MSLYKELSYFKSEIDRVKGIQFTLLSPEEIVRRSVCEVTTTELFNLSEPAPNGLFDTRMGVLDHMHVCKTCEQKNTFCPGHFGHINLAKPVFYPHFFDYVRKTLNCVCFRCSKLLMDGSNADVQAVLNKKISRKKRFDLMYKLCSKITRCGAKTLDGCGAKQPDKITKDKDGVFRILMEWKNLPGVSEDVASNINKQILHAEDVLKILRRISDSDSEALGFCTKFNRPEWMIATVLPVPPPAVRPSVRNDTGQRSEDDLTHKLSSIVKINQALKAKMDKNTSKDQYDMWTQVLQYDVATLIDNNIPGLPPAHQRTGRPIKSLSERLKGKEGRIRGNLMGKRVDFSARSVITPDPNISIDELGVPIKIAMNLTFPEIVNDITMKDLQDMVRAGPDVYPGAKYVIKTHDDNRKIRLRNVNRDHIASELCHGDVVERHLRDGDYVLFNRQPSLHKMSMMAHKVCVMPYNTFRLNVCVTPSFNADFDGDEMNAHVPQSLQTQQELISLAAVPQQIMSPRDSVPIVSIVQDIALGVYRLTKSHVKLHEKQMYNVLAPIIEGIKPIPEAAYGTGTNTQRWSGRQLLSTIIPPNINIRSSNKFFDERKEDDRDNYVVIENGEIKQGTVDKSIYQARSKGLIHSIYNEYGPDDTKHFFDNTQKLICNWLVYSGFSTGISDLIVDSDTLGKCEDVIKDMKIKVTEFITKVHKGELDNKSTKNNADYFEQQVNNLLNRAAKQVGDMAASRVDDLQNRMINMIKSGAKGSEINFAQMIGCLGQQNVDGARISYGFDERTLPHFTKYDDGAEARGFVQNSFIGGLTPQEFFFHAMGGREGLIDTAVKSVTGDTPIVIMENGVSKYVRIGDWIDARLELQKECVVYYPNDRNLEMLKLDNLVYIPTMDEDGVVTWGVVTDMTRHDPGTRLYKIKTLSGREVIVTESKSLLIWNNLDKKFKEVLTPEIKVGDHVPVTAQLITPPIVSVQCPTTGIKFTHETGLYVGAHLDDLKYDITDFIGATREFILGLLTSFFKSIGRVLEHGVIVASCSTPRIAEAIAMMCSRLGIFVGIKHGCHIQVFGRWAAMLSLQLDLPVNFSNDETTLYHNDVVLDTIVEIEIMGVDAHPKMYDLTIPSTLNFGLANGLQVRDTSSTGYIQRQLVKAMEDCKVHQDFTVRNATGAIVQFLYGEDGMDAVKIEAQGVPYITMTLDKMADEFLIGDKIMLKALLKPELYDTLDNTELVGACARHFDEVIEDRRYMIEDVNKGGNNAGISYPVNIQRMITGVYNMYAKYGADMTLDLSPLYVLEQIDKMCKTLYVTKTTGVARFFQMLLRAHLSPKRVLFKFRLCKAAFDLLIQQITQRFFDSIAHPGDMVGVVAAQSVGEPTTQLTLNSVEYSTSLVLKINGQLQRISIGEFIDARIEISQKDMLEHHPNDTWLAWIRDADVQVLSCDESGKIDWQKVEAVTKHPVVNMDGSDTLLKVTTRSGREVIATKAKSFLKRAGNKIVPIEGDELCVGDRIPVSRTRPMYEHSTSEQDMEYVPDVVLSSGTISLLHRDKIKELLLTTNTTDKAVLEAALTEEVLYDEVVAIDEVRSQHPYVYDLTVENTRNFNLYNGLCMRDTFHSAGISSASKAVRGVPRLQELLSVTKKIKTPIMTIHVKQMYRTQSVSKEEYKTKCLDVLNQLSTTRFRDVVTRSRIYFDPDDFDSRVPEDKTFIDMYRMFHDVTEQNTTLSPWLLRLEFDRQRMVNIGVHMIDIQNVLEDFYDDRVSCMFSDDNATHLVMRIKLTSDTSDSGEDMLSEIKALEYNIMQNVMIKGIPGIEKISMREQNSQYYGYNRESSVFEQVSEWIMDTDGSNLRDVMNNRHINPYLTMTNSINEIYEVLGVEAAKRALYNEIIEVLSGINVNYRHISLLIDTMTNKGVIMPINRHGINRGDAGPLAKCSFEEVTDMLVSAGVFAEMDKINGVSANVILGQIAPCGTGDSDLIMDEHVMQRILKETNTSNPKYQPRIRKETEEVCAPEKFSIAMTLPKAVAPALTKTMNISFV